MVAIGEIRRLRYLQPIKGLIGGRVRYEGYETRQYGLPAPKILDKWYLRGSGFW